MALLINGTEPDIVKVNGTEVDKVKVNGTQVWKKFYGIWEGSADVSYATPGGATIRMYIELTRNNTGIKVHGSGGGASNSVTNELYMENKQFYNTPDVTAPNQYVNFRGSGLNIYSVTNYLGTEYIEKTFAYDIKERKIYWVSDGQLVLFPPEASSIPGCIMHLPIAWEFTSDHYYSGFIQVVDGELSAIVAVSPDPGDPSLWTVIARSSDTVRLL